ncbi:putative leader peptide [Streptomyces sp. NPDC060064]
MTRVADPGTRLTAPAIHRHADAVPQELLLYGRPHVDLVRNASARCPAV